MTLYSFRTLQTVCFDVFNKSASSSIVYCLSLSSLLFSNICARLIVRAGLVPLEITEFSIIDGIRLHRPALQKYAVHGLDQRHNRPHKITKGCCHQKNNLLLENLPICCKVLIINIGICPIITKVTNKKQKILKNPK